MLGFLEIIKQGGFLVLDTETTGLEHGEIVQIAIIDDSGSVLVNTLVKPIGRVPVDATKIHGITNTMVASAPTFSDILPLLLNTLTKRNVIVYNAAYDLKILTQSTEAAHAERINWKILATWWCAMEAFAEIYGDWNPARKTYRWQKLSKAAAYYEIALDENAHTALADCLTTLSVVKAMALGDK